MMTLVLRGLPAKTIARTLPVTPNTANDHIKAIFAKTGISSRGDLMATLFQAHRRIWYLPGNPLRRAAGLELPEPGMMASCSRRQGRSCRLHGRLPVSGVPQPLPRAGARG